MDNYNSRPFTRDENGTITYLDSWPTSLGDDYDEITAGTTQTFAGATAINVGYTLVTTENDNDGVKLSETIRHQTIINSSAANNLKVYPPTEAMAVDFGGVAGVAVVIPPYGKQSFDILA